MNHHITQAPKPSGDQDVRVLFERGQSIVRQLSQKRETYTVSGVADAFRQSHSFAEDVAASLRRKNLAEDYICQREQLQNERKHIRRLTALVYLLLAAVALVGIIAYQGWAIALGSIR